MRLKKNKKNKTEAVAARVTLKDYNSIQQKANIYSDGNISEYLVYAALNFVPSKEDFEEKKNK